MIKKLDITSQACAFPLIEAQSAMAASQVGDELVIDFDCTQATASLPQWAAEQGYVVIDYQQVSAAQWSITLKKLRTALRTLHQGCSEAVCRREDAEGWR